MVRLTPKAPSLLCFVLAFASASMAQLSNTSASAAATHERRVNDSQASAATGVQPANVAARPSPRLTEPAPLLPGSVTGTVLDQSGAIMVGARVQLSQDDQARHQELLSNDDGQFSFANVVPGVFHLSIAVPGFTTHVFSGAIRSGEAYIVPPMLLTVANAVTEVWVKVPISEIATAQVQEQEKQRVLGFIPNFYVSYVSDAVPLSPGQKFHLAFKSTTDPFTSVGVAMLAGTEQATDALAGYGQGAQGFAKRYGASYADVVTGTFIGSAILPSLLKQDPRYFYKGTGSTRSRLLYALRSPVFCKGDNKSWQPNYSNVMGAFAAGGLSYLYYPASDRNGFGLLAKTAAIRIGETSFEAVLQEFVVRRLTPRVRKRAIKQP